MCFSLPASIRPSILTRSPPFFPFHHHLLLPPSLFIPLYSFHFELGFKKPKTTLLYLTF
ncbi:hypothetical protein HanXRQr2_Chr03g0092731 [Helianthus annuus]|uniref:Uncharacterized protein n=1 Tax=Helianthus annuus TaxID=4232 RepID=A0A251V469_HELAN|nr:hypothetical protein HanXRQr2_Chr03g0092731 [Helianthus annuus]KAJ0606766.1 hypothetical protein HanHA89_Chr03g0088841 [Helianthus annuus]KAJ0766826.1 hypothetical protein HanLR1_Chr03g0082021 [Helianthus annuus]